MHRLPPAPARSRHATALLVMATLVSMGALTACAGSTPAHSSGGGGGGSSSSPAPATPPTGRPPVASTLWADATRSLAKRRTVHFHDWFGNDRGSLAGRPIVMDFDVFLDGSRMHGTETDEAPTPQTEQLIIDNHYYEKHTEGMLRSLAGRDRALQDALVERVDGRWIALGTDTPGDGPVRLATHLLDPKHPAVRAFAGKGATVTPTTFAGRSAWKATSADGTQRAWVAADASHDLLRVESSAATKRDTAETIELSRFDVPFTVETPHDTVPYSVIDDAINANYGKH